jgi:hypothetical protein
MLSKIMVALKLGPRPAYVNYAAIFCYLILAIFLIKLTFWTGNAPNPQIIVPNQSENYMTADSKTPYEYSRSYITWAQVKIAGLRTTPDLGDAKNEQLSENQSIFKPIGSQILHRSEEESRRSWPRASLDEIK